MSIKKLPPLIFLLILVSVCYYFLVINNPEKGKTEAKSNRLFNFAIENVQEITIKKNTDGLIHLKKDAEGWKIISPVKAFARSEAIYDYLNIIKKIVNIMIVDENPSKISVFGLASPMLSVDFKLINGNSYNLLLGNDNPNGTCVYAKFKNLPTVFLIGNLYKLELDKKVQYFQRKKTI